ncbi:MAG: hypothetical protein EOO65_01335 [Methanosarcinales archaeon]|nr:MAG: hypothetical protein EOO65_01335 [Methanosarcinales archaeon]
MARRVCLLHCSMKKPCAPSAQCHTTLCLSIPRVRAERGGGKAKKPAKAVVITKRERGRGKCVTSITGLDGFDVKLKEAASALGKKFGTGATVTKNAMNEQEVDVQGDLMYELPEVLEALFGIPEDAIIVKD